jgi:hypothetical protein
MNDRGKRTYSLGRNGAGRQVQLSVEGDVYRLREQASTGSLGVVIILTADQIRDMAAAVSFL